jgi:hypothetical protein
MTVRAGARPSVGYEDKSGATAVPPAVSSNSPSLSERTRSRAWPRWWGGRGGWPILVRYFTTGAVLDVDEYEDLQD